MQVVVRPYPIELRQRIVEAYEAGEGSIEELAERFAVHRSTVINLLRLYRQTGALEPRPHAGGNPGKVHDKDMQTLRELVGEKNDRTQTELAEQLALRGRCKVHQTTIGRALRWLRMTRKKEDLRASEQDRPAVKRHRTLFRRRAGQWSAQRVIFVDEFGTNLGQTRTHGYAPQGQRALGSAPVNTDPHLTLVLGMGQGAVVAPLAFAGAMNRHTFHQYAQNVLGPELRPGDVVVADRLAAHCSPEAKRAVARAFETQQAKRGFSLVEILSPCPTYWRMTPDAAAPFDDTDPLHVADGGVVAAVQDRPGLRARHQGEHAARAGEQFGRPELFAEELRLTQEQLNSITGEFVADDLLGEIFSRFCIGK